MVFPRRQLQSTRERRRSLRTARRAESAYPAAEPAAATASTTRPAAPSPASARRWGPWTATAATTSVPTRSAAGSEPPSVQPGTSRGARDPSPSGARTRGHRIHQTRRPPGRSPPRRPCPTATGVVAGTRTRPCRFRSAELDAPVLPRCRGRGRAHRVRTAPTAGTVRRRAQAATGFSAARLTPTGTSSATT